MKTKLIIILVMMSLQSCDQIMDQAEEKRAQENFTSEYMGYYSGSYTGDYKGSLKVIVRKDASVQVIRGTAGNPDSYITSLIMSSFNTTSRSPDDFMLIGNMQTKNGTWEMGNFKGTWSIIKD
ncbi:hypothetical protein PGH12_00350 [Chryseobacterium wangxinyae]|uniref:hypothetical protein n=1 Tax=Chryseobacterium sp. CY350 TaxID=2997336 RepID=UPI00226D6B3D|nr:hypothetical protein [Chryseobacterium sp. CY350]MCY0977372.1 hypothetical protein [Chryseobacterium sp. CY350]WBZ95609.1 hypothetical protein PGH12_00350 [Chryseobacterium sp. CY350]